MASFFTNATRHTKNCCARGFPGFNVRDALPVTAALVPGFVVSSDDLCLAVELGCTSTRGQLVHATSPLRLADANRNVTVVKKMDRNILSSMFKNVFVSCDITKATREKRLVLAFPRG